MDPTITNKIQKPKPLKVYGRHHYACTRCKLSKIKCSGEKPSCSNCKNINKPESCKYPKKDRKIVIMESELNNLHEKVQQLENQLLLLSSSSSTSNNNQQFFTIRDNLKFFFENEFENYQIQFNLINQCLKKIPNKSYCLILIEKVYYTYNQEFYLIDKNEIQPLIDNVYELSIHLSNPNYIPCFTQISLCYFFILIAFGEQLLNVNTINSNKYPGLEYYQFAEHLFRLTRPNMSITFIQCGLLLGLYSANLAQYNTVYNFFGIATRSAVNQGYHRNKEILDINNKSNLEIHNLKIIHEKMKRLWWTIFVIDTTWSTKSVHLQYTDTDVNLPCENIYQLNNDDILDLNTLELNVQLTKYVAKFNRLIYGPNNRTFSIKYINTNQFNQKQLFENIINSNNEIIKNFQIPYLLQFKKINYLNHSKRIIANLFLRYHQLIISISNPLLSIIFNNSCSTILTNQNSQLINQTISKGIFTSCATIDIISKLYTNNKIFILGYWDSQHLFTAILMLIKSQITSPSSSSSSSSSSPYPPQVLKGIALLKFMADLGNINAKNRIQKIYQINSLLQFPIDLNLCNVENTIFDYKDYYSTSLSSSSSNSSSSSSNSSSSPPIPSESSNDSSSSSSSVSLVDPMDSLPYLPESYTSTLRGIDKSTTDLIINILNKNNNNNNNQINDKNYQDFNISLIELIQSWDD